MGIDDQRNILDGLKSFVPEEYVPTEFKVIFHFDMDGVLAQWMTEPEKVFDNPLFDGISNSKDSGATGPAYLRDNYYLVLPPYEEMVEAVRQLTHIKQIHDTSGVVYNVDVNICSCVPGDSNTAVADKHRWGNYYLPEVTSRTFVAYDENSSGINKALAMGLPVPTTDGIDIGLSPRYIEHCSQTFHIHFDDNTKVLKDLMQYNNQIRTGVIGVKCLNGINDTHKSFEGPRLNILESSGKILKNMLSIASNELSREAVRRFELTPKEIQGIRVENLMAPENNLGSKERSSSSHEI